MFIHSRTKPSSKMIPVGISFIELKKGNRFYKSGYRYKLRANAYCPDSNQCYKDTFIYYADTIYPLREIIKTFQNLYVKANYRLMQMRAAAEIDITHGNNNTLKYWE